MLSQDERYSLYEWVSKSGLKVSRGIANDFRDGVYVIELLNHYLPRTFNSTLLASSAPSKCIKNWEHLRDNELQKLGVPVTDIYPFAIGKIDREGKPYIEDLLWAIKNAVINYRPRTSKKTARPITALNRPKKIVSYLEELDSNFQPNDSSTTSRNSGYQRNHGSLEYLGGNRSSLTPKSAKKKHIMLPPIPNQNKNNETQKKPWYDRLDGDDDGKFFGISFKSNAVKSDKDIISELNEKIKQLESKVNSQQEELNSLHAGNKRLNIDKNPTTETTSKKANTSYQMSNDPISEIPVASITYIEDQSQEQRGKAWINFKLENGKLFNVFYDERERDVKIGVGAHRFTDPIESLEFDTTEKPLSWGKLAKWLESKECGFESNNNPENDAILFVAVVKHFVTKNTTREVVVEQASKQIPLKVNKNPTPADERLFAEFKDEVIAKIAELRKRDKAHNQNYTLGVEVQNWKLVACARNEVAYGIQHFGKIDIGNNKFIHIRAHEFFNDKPTSFHSIDTGRETCIHDAKSPLLYFDY